jgi:hypothetical protein
MAINKKLRTCKYALGDNGIVTHSETAGVFRVLTSMIDSLIDEKGEEIPIEIGDIVYFTEDDSYFLVLTAPTSTIDIRYYDKPELHWNKMVFENPSVLNYWFDFLDTSGELNQYSVKAIGARTKAINENTIKSIYFRETPQVVFTTDITEETADSAYKYIQVPEFEMEKMFSISAQGKSAKERLDELLYAHGYCTESATITTIPIYYL